MIEGPPFFGVVTAICFTDTLGKFILVAGECSVLLLAGGEGCVLLLVGGNGDVGLSKVGRLSLSIVAPGSETRVVAEATFLC